MKSTTNVRKRKTIWEKVLEENPRGVTETVLRKRLDRLMADAGFPKSLNTFNKRIDRLDKVLAAEKHLNLGPAQRRNWMYCLAVGPRTEFNVERIKSLAKEYISQLRKAAVAKRHNRDR